VKAARWSGVALACAVFLALAGDVGARADTGATVAEFGWWSQRPAASAQSGGGFEVADSPAGALSVAAVRIAVQAPSLTSATLRLPENQPVGTAILQACSTTSAWTAAGPGDWSQRPQPNCASAIPLKRDDAAVAWTVNVLPLLPPGTREATVMIVPGPAATPVPAPFQITFRGAELTAEAGPAETPPPASSGAIPGSTGDAFGAVPSTGQLADFAVPPPLAAPAAPATPSSEQIVAAPAQTSGRFPTQGQVGVPAAHTRKPWGRLPLLVLAAVVVGTVTGTGRRQLVARGLLPS
jgi:hypothetical protein